MNDVVFRKQLKMRAGCQETNRVIRGLELSVLPDLHLWGERRDWRLNPSPVASDEISHAYAVRSPLKPKRAGFRGLPGWWTCGNSGRVAHPHLDKTWKLQALSPCLVLCISSTWLLLSYIFLNKLLVKCSPEFCEPKEEIVRTSQVCSQLVRSTGDDLDLWLTSEVQGSRVVL